MSRFGVNHHLLGRLLVTLCNYASKSRVEERFSEIGLDVLRSKTREVTIHCILSRRPIGVSVASIAFEATLLSRGPWERLNMGLRWQSEKII